jgi:hypothetical protein
MIDIRKCTKSGVRHSIFYELICAWKGWLYVSLWKLLFVFLYHWHFGGLWTTFLDDTKRHDIRKHIPWRYMYFTSLWLWVHIFFLFYFWNFKWLWRVKRLSFKKVSFSSGGRVQAREKDDYMFLYESYYLFSYIIDISVDFEPHFYKIIMSKFNVIWTFIIYFTKHVHKHIRATRPTGPVHDPRMKRILF